LLKYQNKLSGTERKEGKGVLLFLKIILEGGVRPPGLFAYSLWDVRLSGAK